MTAPATDLNMVVTVGRDLLGAGALQLTPSAIYYLTPQFLGAAVTWNRQQAASPWIDGQFTTQRSRGNVTEAIGVEIRAHSGQQLQDATNELIAAFIQDHFILNVTVSGAYFAYDCEAADYQIAHWTTPRLVSFQGQVLFQVPRQPVALAGGH